MSRQVALISGVYKIESKVHPERIYIGSAVNIRHRLMNHVSSLKRGDHHSQKLQRHFNKYGLDDLMFSVLAICEKSVLIPINGIIPLEQSFILEYKYKDDNKPYFNNSPTAGSNMGWCPSVQTRKKNSQSNMGRQSWNKGQTKETDPRINGRPLGYQHLPESKEKMSEARKGKYGGENHPMHGKHHTEETKELLRKANVGKKQSEETITKRSLANKGRKQSPEFCQKMSIVMVGNKNSLGHHHSEETKAVLREKQIGRVYSEASKQKMSISHLGKKPTEEQLKKQSAPLKKWWANKKLGKERSVA